MTSIMKGLHTASLNPFRSLSSLADNPSECKHLYKPDSRLSTGDAKLVTHCVLHLTHQGPIS